MASHSVLFPKLVAAIRGEKVRPSEIKGGSLNYRSMVKATKLLVSWTPANHAEFVAHLNNMLSTGHMSLSGEHGVACEQGSPGMHWTFNTAPVIGVYRECHRRNDIELGSLCEEVILNEIGLDRAFRFGKKVVMPAPRIKGGPEERKLQMQPFDGYRDVFLALALGETVKRPARYWAEDQAIAVAVMRDLVKSEIWDDEKQAEARRTLMPPLYLPTLSRPLPDDGFVAWIEDTEEARRAMGKDACHWVRCAGKNDITWGYDFATPVPEN